MSQELKPIGDYGHLVGSMSLGEYLAHDPPAVLLQDATTGQFEALQGDPGDTLPRLQPESSGPTFDSMDANPDEALPREIAYMVLELNAGPERQTLSIGCAEDCDLVIRETTLSRRHATIDRRGESYFLRDLDSTAGTYYNGERLDVRTKIALRPGDRVGLGGVDLTFLDAAGFFHFVQRFLAG